MTYERVSEAANYLTSRTNYRPKIAVICGSGLGKSIPNRLKIARLFVVVAVPFHFWFPSARKKGPLMVAEDVGFPLHGM